MREVRLAMERGEIRDSEILNECHEPSSKFPLPSPSLFGFDNVRLRRRWRGEGVRKFLAEAQRAVPSTGIIPLSVVWVEDDRHAERNGGVIGLDREPRRDLPRYITEGHRQG